MPPPDLEIVEIVRRGDLHRAGALLRIGIAIPDDRDRAADQRQDGALADQVRKAPDASGCTATAVSPSIVSGRVVATMMNRPGSPSIG